MVSSGSAIWAATAALSCGDTGGGAGAEGAWEREGVEERAVVGERGRRGMEFERLGLADEALEQFVRYFLTGDGAD